jgi:hypothetical protein
MKRTIKFVRQTTEDSSQFIARVFTSLNDLRQKSCTFNSLSISVESITEDPLALIYLVTPDKTCNALTKTPEKLST